MNVFAAILLLCAVILFLVDWAGRSSRSLIGLGLACFAAGVLLAAVWPAHQITF